MKKIFTSSPLSLDFGLLLLRVLLAAGLLTHGIAKIANFSALSTSFLDPLALVCCRLSSAPSLPKWSARFWF